MKKMSGILVLVAFLLLSFSVIHPALLIAEDQAAAPAAPKAPEIAPATPAAPPVSAEAAVKATEPADVVVDDEGTDDVAVLKQAADELQKAGKADLAKKVRDIAEGMDW